MAQAHPPGERPRTTRIMLFLLPVAALVLLVFWPKRNDEPLSIGSASAAAPERAATPKAAAQSEPFGFDALIINLHRALNEPPEAGTPIKWQTPHRWRLNKATIDAVRAFRGEDQVVFETLTNRLGGFHFMHSVADRAVFARATLAMTLLSTNVPGVREYLWLSLSQRRLPEATLQALAALGLTGEDLPRLSDALVGADYFRFRVLEAVDAAFAADPAGAAANLGAFEARLTDETSAVRYFAACVLARYSENISPDWLSHIAGNLSAEAWTPSSFGVQTLAALGPRASAALPALQEHHATIARAARYPSVEESLRRQEEILRAILAIDPNAADSVPAVAEFFERQQRAANITAQIDDGSCSPAELLAALQDPHLARSVIEHLPQITEATPEMIAVLSQGIHSVHDGDLKEQLYQTIQTLHPGTEIRRINTHHLNEALNGLAKEIFTPHAALDRAPFSFIRRHQEELQDGSTWFTDQNLRDLHDMIANLDFGYATIFTDRLVELDPTIKEVFKPYAP